MNFRIGIDLGGTKIEGVLMTETGEIQESLRVNTPSDYIQTISSLKQLVEQLDTKAGQTCPVGLATPGAWMEHRGAMKNCNSTCLNGKPFLTDVKKVLARPVRIANDADCFALSEATDGAAAGSHSAFGVILGTGVGGGWVIDGRLIQGPNALAGEWGHNVMPLLRQDDWTREFESDMEDRRCYCGRWNCVETFLSGPGLERTHFELHGDRVAGQDLVESAGGEQTLTLYIGMLARALAQMVNAIDPEVIVLGGGVSNIERLYADLPDAIRRYSFSSEGRTNVVKAKYGDSSGKRGAAWLFPA